MTITTRIEQAGADQQRELLLEVFRLLCPHTPLHMMADFERWHEKEIKFTRMLDAEAYLSAAEMLVPNGVEWGVYRIQYDNKGCPAAFVGETGERLASTPALALLSAILRAGESG